MESKLLDRRLKSWRRQCRSRIFLEGTIWLSAGLWAFLEFFVLLDSFRPLPQAARWIFLFLGVSSWIFLLWVFLLRPILFFSLEKMILEVQRLRPGLKPYLFTAWEFARKGAGPFVSEELVRMHLKKTQELLADPSLKSLFSLWPSRQAAACGFLFLSLGLSSYPLLKDNSSSFSRVLAPWKDVPLEDILEIRPKSAFVAWGGSAAVEARWLYFSREEAVLYLKTPKSSWQRQAWDESSAGRFSYNVGKITEPVDYQVRLRDYKTGVYTLTPVLPPEFAQVRYTLRHLAYLGKPVETVFGGGDIEALEGTEVTLSGKTDRPVEKALLYLGSRSRPIEFKKGKNGEYEASFVVRKDESFYWKLVSVRGIAESAPWIRQIRALKDEPPQVEILSPSFDLIASPRTSLPVTYSFRDDYGVSKVELFYKLSVWKEEKSKPVASFEKPSAGELKDTFLELGAFPSDNTLEFYLKATDGKRPHPQEGVSQKIRVELYDFEGRHEEAQKGLELLLKELESLAAGEEEFQKLLKSGGFSSAEAVQQALEKKWDGALDGFSEALKVMEKDAFLHPDVLAAVQAQAENLSFARQEVSPRALEAAQKKNWTEAGRLRGALLKELQKSAKALARAQDFSRIEDLLAHSEQMSEAGAEMRSLLEDLKEDPKGASPEKLKQLKKALEKVQSQMIEMARTLEKLPKELRTAGEQERKNVEAVSLSETYQLTQELEKALSEGDVDAAMKALEKLSERLKKIESAVQQAAAPLNPSRTDSSEESGKTAELIREVLEKQEEALNQTKGLDGKLSQAQREAQDSRLKELALRQRKWVKAAQERKAPQGIAEKMASAAANMEKGNAPQASRDLREVLGRMRPLGDAWKDVIGGEEEILGQLSLPAPKPELGLEEAREFEKILAAQEKVIQKTGEARKSAKELGISIQEKLEEASQEMEEAVSGLEKQESSQALNRQKKAMEILEGALKELEASAGRQEKMELGAFQSSPQRYRGLRRAPPGGETGTAVAPVRLPKATDYQPPQEIRKEVLKSLQERYPQSYEPIIREYFKRITK